MKTGNRSQESGANKKKSLERQKDRQTVRVEDKPQTEGGWCLWWGTWSGRLSIQCQGWVRFPASALSTLSLLSAGFMSLCSPPRIGQDGVRPQNRSWRRSPCQNHSDFTTHGTCEHDTDARWKTACRNNSVMARAIWNECSRPTSLDLVDPSPYYCQVQIPPPLTNIFCHTWTPWIKAVYNASLLTVFNLCRSTYHVCVWQKYLHERQCEKNQKIKDVGCGA